MIIVKIGGSSEVNIKGIAEDILKINQPTIIIHGANYFRDQLAKKLGYKKQVITSISGHTSVYSDKTLIELMMMSYAGLRNKQIVAELINNGINAIGLSGIDGKLVVAKKNRGIRTKVNEKTIIKRDLSGKPKTINKELLDILLKNNYLPVITMPLISEEGEILNSENDDLVALLSKVYNPSTIFQLIAAKGLLKDINDPNSFYKKLSYAQLKNMENIIDGRMRRKIYAILKTLENNPSCKIIITSGLNSHPLIEGLNGIGTLVSYND